MAHRKQLKQIVELGVSWRQMNDHLLHDAVVALAQEAARARVAAAAPAALTDNSGGTGNANFILSAVVTPTKGIVDGVTTFAPKAGFDTATTAIEAAHKELAEKANAFLALITGTTGQRVTMAAGGAADGTIGAITAELTAAASATLDAATGIAEITKARNVQAALASAVNYIRVAMGLHTVTDGTGGKFLRTITGWNVDSDARAASGTSPANGAETLTDASVDAALVALRNGIATLADALDQARGTLGIGPFVVATSNPRTRMVNADVTV